MDVWAEDQGCTAFIARGVRVGAGVLFWRGAQRVHQGVQPGGWARSPRVGHRPLPGKVRQRSCSASLGPSACTATVPRALDYLALHPSAGCCVQQI